MGGGISPLWMHHMPSPTAGSRARAKRHLSLRAVMNDNNKSTTEGTADAEFQSRWKLAAKMSAEVNSDGQNVDLRSSNGSVSATKQRSKVTCPVNTVKNGASQTPRSRKNPVFLCNAVRQAKPNRYSPCYPALQGQQSPTVRENEEG